jgi:hypothetical protein
MTVVCWLASFAAIEWLGADEPQADTRARKRSSAPQLSRRRVNTGPVLHGEGVSNVILRSAKGFSV